MVKKKRRAQRLVFGTGKRDNPKVGFRQERGMFFKAGQVGKPYRRRKGA